MIPRWLAHGVAASIGCAPLFAAEDAVPASVRVEMLMVSVSVPDARMLVPQFQDTKTAQRTFERVQEMIAQDKATLIGWPIVWIRCLPSADGSGDRSVCESVHEFRYPTEIGHPRAVTHPPDPFASFGPGSNWGPFVPTAFETRPINVALGAEAWVENEGRAVLLALDAQFIRFLEFRTYRAASSPWGIVGLIQQPDFATSKVDSWFRVAHDRPVLAGVFVREQPQSHIELFILRARVNVLPREVVFPTPSSPP